MKQMRLLLSFFICLFVNVSCATNIYISSSSGDDSNPGTIEKPLKSISAVKEKKNVNIWLLRGDVFYEKITGFHMCSFNAYGDGPKPVLCGFRILKNPNAWVKCEQNGLWKLDLYNTSDFDGFKYKNATSMKSLCNVGVIYSCADDKIYGEMAASLEKLSDVGSFYVSSAYIKEGKNHEDFRWLYFKSPISPDKLGKLCFSVGETCISNVDSCTFENLSIVGFGKHGISPKSNTIISNCDIDIIGGSLHLKNYFCRLGNGVEVWVPVESLVENIKVENCQITRTYDTATTIQGAKTNNSKVRNIHFVNNRIAFCRQAFERYLKPKESNAYYEQCSFENNLVYMCGSNLFGTRVQDNNVNLLSYEEKGRPIKISNNTFWGGSLQYSQEFATGIENNTFYIYRGDVLLNKNKTRKAIVAENDKSIDLYKRVSLDESNIIIVDKKSSQDDSLKEMYRKQALKNFPIIKDLDCLNNH
ncbi:MAG: hypothetical protein J6I79_01515 [Paludibacteraceae bacterium]|nr:hypothetical protein [Paludibacteraceae bacterium]